MKYQNGAWGNSNAVKAYEKYVRLSNKPFENKSTRERKRDFERLYKR